MKSSAAVPLLSHPASADELVEVLLGLAFGRLDQHRAAHDRRKYIVIAGSLLAITLYAITPAAPYWFGAAAFIAIGYLGLRRDVPARS